MTFENVDLAVLGSARKVIVTKDETTIIEGAGPKAAVQSRITQINKQIDAATSEYDKENMEKRRAALQGKVAVIKVGGATETEIEEKKFRVDDAVHAVKAALDEGVVAGGGVTFADLSKLIPVEESTIAGAAGAGILKSALLEPFRQLMTNSGLNAEAKLEKVLDAKSGMGFDVNKPDKLVNLKEAGIVDPTRVVKEAVQNAVSVAGTAMTMGALVADVPEKAPPMPPGGPGGGMDMGM
jgi:chaperonin GroEL